MFDMGEYAVFVWPAYGLSAATLVWLTVDTVLRARRWKAEVARREAEQKR